MRGEINNHSPIQNCLFVLILQLFGVLQTNKKKGVYRGVSILCYDECIYRISIFTLPGKKYMNHH